MRLWIGERVTYANVVSTLALFIALGGTSYALSVPRNSVGSAQLRADSVGQSEVRRGAVRSSELRDRGVRLRDISTGARTALQGQSGPPGPAGPPGTAFFQTVTSFGGRGPGN